MYGELDFWYLRLIGYCWYCVYVVCVSNYKVDVVVVWIACVRDSVISLCVYTCGEMEADRDIDELFDVVVFNDGRDVEVVTG